MFTFEGVFWTVVFVVSMPTLAVACALLVRRKIGVDVLACPEAFEQALRILTR